MMGRQVEQAALFYEFRLEERVPVGHLLRRVDAVLDLGWVREHMAGHYSTMGRPSICPELMVRMLLVGYLFGIRSERRLCEEVDLNLAHRWFCRLGLDGRVPDHSSFTKARHGRFRDSGPARARCSSAWSGSASRPAWPRPRRRGGRLQRAGRSIKDGPGRFAYGLNAMVDTASGIVLDVQAVPARHGDEPKATQVMIERLLERHGLTPRVLTADKAHGSGPFLAWLGSRGIEAHVRAIEHLERHERRRQAAGLLPRSAFAYDAASDSYTCPQGARLGAVGGGGSVVQYVSRVRDCRPCPVRAGCTPDLRRKLNRSRHEEVRQEVLAREPTPAFQASLRLRGLRGAGEQFLLAATARNLKRMAQALRATPSSAI